MKAVVTVFNFVYFPSLAPSAQYLFNPRRDKYIPHPRSLPLTIHNCPIQPVETLYLLEPRAHGVAPVAGALQRRCDAVLGVRGCEVAGCEDQGFVGGEEAREGECDG